MQNPILTPRSRPLTLAGLRGFEAAARLASLTAAANAPSLTQSAVSRQVQGLEDELGVSLFVRKAREIALTPAGREFLPLVQRVLHDLSHVVALRTDQWQARTANAGSASVPPPGCRGNGNRRRARRTGVVIKVLRSVISTHHRKPCRLRLPVHSLASPRRKLRCCIESAAKTLRRQALPQDAAVCMISPR